MEQGLEGRFWSKVEKSDGCWIWVGAKNTQGYGSFKFDGHIGKAHRYSFQLAHGPIADGLTLDHLCRVRACVRPEHLEAVSHQENCSRRPQRTICKRGHEFTSENTAIYGGKRICRACVRLTQAVRRWAVAIILLIIPSYVFIGRPSGSEPREVPISTRTGGPTSAAVAS